MDILIKCIILLNTLCLFKLCIGSNITNENITNANINNRNTLDSNSDTLDTEDLLADEELLNYTELVRKPANFQRTQIFIYAITSPGEYIFIRGGKMNILSYC